MNTNTNQRRYDLDWLRIGAFGLLIFYHVARFYNDEPWHYKSIYISDFLQPLMNLISPWRLSLLFFISGVAVKFAMDKYSEKPRYSFAWNRYVRLSIPLIFGMIVIVAPQAYYEVVYVRELAQPGFWAFYPDYLSMNQKWAEVFTPTYNHLWYVLYVLIYTLFYVAIKPMVDKFSDWLSSTRLSQSIAILFIYALPFVLYRFTTDIWMPQTNDITTGDFGAHIRFGSWFLLGAIIAKSDSFWIAVSRNWRIAAIASIVMAVFLTVVWQNWSMLEENGILMNFARVCRILYIWWVIFTLLGLAQAYLNKPSKTLSYLTEAIFPYYIIHQTAILMLGFYLTSLQLGPVFEFTLVTIGTVATCVLMHEYLIRPYNLVRPLFGLKQN